MTNKINAPMWLVGFLHWFISSFFSSVTLIAGSWVILLLLGIDSKEKMNNYFYLIGITGFIFSMIGLWVGIKVSIKYLKRKYFIDNWTKSIKFALIFCIIWNILSFFWTIFIASDHLYITGVVGFIIYLSLFYVLSKKEISSDVQS